MTLLAVGLFAAGVGTMAFLRNTLIVNLDASLQQAVTTDIGSTVFDIQNFGGVLSLTATETSPPAGNVLAIYGPDGDLEAVASTV